MYLGILNLCIHDDEVLTFLLKKTTLKIKIFEAYVNIKDLFIFFTCFSFSYFVLAVNLLREMFCYLHTKHLRRCTVLDKLILETRP